MQGVTAKCSRVNFKACPNIQTFSFSFMTCSLEKLGLVYQNRLEHDLFALVLRALLVGRRQQSESTDVAFGMK